MSSVQDFRDRWSRHTPYLMGAARRFAVLCPLIARPEGLSFLFEVRAAGLQQSGEVCFPGGRAEAGETAVQCALRETWEELGIPSHQIEIIGQSDFLVHQRGFLLQPVIGLVDQEALAALRPSPAEVAEVFTVPVSFFQSTPPEMLSYRLVPQLPEDFPYDGIGISPSYAWGSGQVDVPVWRYQSHVIWGMTARILRDILTHMKAVPES